MGTIDKYRFEARGARGCGDSDYNVCQTTCCAAWCVEDDELSELYFDANALSSVIILISVYGDEIVVCPVCGAHPWDLVRPDELSGVPEAWRWALSR